MTFMRVLPFCSITPAGFKKIAYILGLPSLCLFSTLWLKPLTSLSNVFSKNSIVSFLHQCCWYFFLILLFRILFVSSFCKSVKQNIKKAKRNYVEKAFNNSNPKNIWETINFTINNKHDKSNEIDINY